jgi:hypothetical protein
MSLATFVHWVSACIWHVAHFWEWCACLHDNIIHHSDWHMNLSVWLSVIKLDRRHHVLYICWWGLKSENMSPGGSLGVKVGTHVRKRFSKWDPFPVVTGGENGTLFKFWLLKMYPFLRKFSEMYRFQNYFWKKHPIFAIFFPYPNRITIAIQKHTLILRVQVPRAI